ncbi:alpha/beta hydrolase fold-domain-containing protein [Cunninghamella echinulata]|nr:alpha/beta hydrolase fold-domain-containing protein [Cunninghamella echinulata]
MLHNKKVPTHPAYEAILKAMQASELNWQTTEPAILRGIIESAPVPPNVVLPDTLVEEKEITIDLQNTGGLQNSSTLKLIVTRPPGTENKIIPAFIYLVGGGFLFGSYRAAEKFIKDLTVQANVAVIFVSYSLAPEVKFPVATEECYSSILWIHQHANELNIDSSKLVVGGDSAGGNLSTVSSILLKKRGHKDILKGQVLMYPYVAFSGDNYESRQIFGDGDYMLSREDLKRIGKAYLGDIDKKDIDDIRLSPIKATDEELNGLPRALVITAECDVFRDEGEHYAHRLLKAGVKTTAIRSIAAAHGFLTAPVDTENYTQCMDTIYSR